MVPTCFYSCILHTNTPCLWKHVLHSNSRLVSVYSSYTKVVTQMYRWQSNTMRHQAQKYFRCSQKICAAELTDTFTCSTISTVAVDVTLPTALLLTALKVTRSRSGCCSTLWFQKLRSIARAGCPRGVLGRCFLLLYFKSTADDIQEKKGTCSRTVMVP